MGMIQEDYVSFETAKLLKEKGFDAYCHSHYYPYYEDDTMKKKNYDRYRGTVNVKNKLYYEVNDGKGLMRDHYLCPTLQMAMKWLRENHNLYVTSVPNGIGEYVFYPQIYKKFECGWNVLESSLNGFQNTEFSSPEEACEAAIKYCLENLI